jgi:uncharacterized protein YoxC
MKKTFTYIGNNIYKILFLVLGILLILNLFQINKNLKGIDEDLNSIDTQLLNIKMDMPSN